MCVIYAVRSALPDDAELRRGSETNEDGAGLAWLKDGLIHWKKDFKGWEDLKAFALDSKLEAPYVAHFRSASVGGKSTELAHPFPIGEGAPTWEEGTAPEVLFHNGHLSDWEKLILHFAAGTTEKIPEGPWSDSRALAWLTHLKGPGILPFIVGQSRVLLFTNLAETPEDEVYNPEEDHYHFFGSGWIHDKGGWSQSVNTYDRWARTPGRWNYNGYEGYDSDDAETLPTGRTLGTGTATPPKVVAQATIATPYIWTVEELSKILADIVKEQSDAKSAAGV